jgi:uncharacterized cupredoxin-like copper-binding protein
MARRTQLAVAALALTASVGCASASATPNRVITINHSAFSVNVIHVDPGEEVTFEVRNEDPIDHEFLIGDKHMQRIHEKGTEAHHGARPGEISIPANSTRTTTYTFPSGGTLIFGCHLPGHFAYGMKGLIEIG